MQPAGAMQSVAETFGRLMMESYSDDWEEDREYRARYEKRQRMRRERQQRMRRRRMLVRLLFFALLALIIVLRIAAVRSGRKAGEDESTSQEREVAAAQEPDRSEIEKITESIMEKESGEAEGVETEAEEEVRVYRFAETEDTAFMDSVDVISTHAILVDESTDTIIAAKGAKERILPASMTKVLTILVAAEQIPEEKLDDTFTMTLEITDYAYVNDCSSVGFLDGEKDTGGEVLCAKTGYIVQSKNCAVSYGSFAGGTPYICVTAESTSGWRCIYDHVEIYNRYISVN